MGSCVSSDKSVAKQSIMKKNKLSNMSSMKDNKPTVADVVLNSQWPSSRSISSFRDSGSKDDCFFDSKPWLESDCEDDFFSVNGELTPPRGSTPVHPSFSKGNLRVDKSPSDGSAFSPVPGSSPTEKKKRLSELFRDSVRENKNGPDDNLPDGKETMLDHLPKATGGTLSDSGANSVSTNERTANVDPLNEREKLSRTAKGCLPGLASCRSVSERKKMDPVDAVGNAPAAV